MKGTVLFTDIETFHQRIQGIALPCEHAFGDGKAVCHGDGLVDIGLAKSRKLSLQKAHVKPRVMRDEFCALQKVINRFTDLLKHGHII